MTEMLARLMIIAWEGNVSQVRRWCVKAISVIPAIAKGAIVRSRPSAMVRAVTMETPVQKMMSVSMVGVVLVLRKHAQAISVMGDIVMADLVSCPRLQLGPRAMMGLPAL